MKRPTDVVLPPSFHDAGYGALHPDVAVPRHLSALLEVSGYECVSTQLRILQMPDQRRLSLGLDHKWGRVNLMSVLGLIRAGRMPPMSEVD